MAALNSQDNCGLLDQSIPQWKRELILKRRALGRTLQAGSATVKLTCPTTSAAAVGRNAVEAAAGASSETTAVVSGKQQRSSSSVVVSNKSSLDQNEADFHPGSSSAAGSVGNMRLVDQRLEGGNDLVGSVSGVGVSSKVMLDSVKENCALKYISRMGEEKSIIIKQPSVNSKSIMDKYNTKRKHHKPVVGLSENKVTCTNGNEEECLSDSSEELQYGPGIVNKLKTKYLSMTLRENQKRGVRPSLSNLRRATSLENMLEEESKTTQTVTVTCRNAHIGINNKSDGKFNGVKSNKTTTISYPYNYKSLGSRRGLDSMKRACSMDTLLRSDTKAALGLNHNRILKAAGDKDMLNGNKSKISIANEDIIIVENSSSDTNGKINDASKMQINNKIMSIEEKELPPPDVVKQTLKKFENAPTVKTKTFSGSNKTRTQNSKLYRTPGIGANNTNSNEKSRVVKPILSPKPVLSPEKNCSQNRSIKVSTPKRINAKKSEDSNTSRLLISSPVESKEVSTDDGIVVTFCDKKPPTSSKTATQAAVSPVVHIVSNSDSVLTSKPTSPLVDRTLLLESNLPITNGKPENILPVSLSQTQVNSSSTDENNVDGIIPKSVSESALENIRKGGTSVKFSFKTEDNENSASVSKSYLPGAKEHPQATNTTLLANRSSPEPLSPRPVEKSPVRVSAPILKQTESPVTQMKQVGVIRPILTTKLQQTSHVHSSALSKKPPPSPSILTDLEIEKNLINRVKSIEQPVSKVVVAIKNLPDAVVVGSVPADLMSNKNLSSPRVSGGGSEMKGQGLWDKKPWHQNQNTMIFNFSDRKDVPDYIENDGLILRGKRERPRPGEGGIILLEGDGGGQESSTDTDADDWATLRDPPSPCDIYFENDNVLINGKSNLRKHPKQQKLRIQFNDQPTRFEYPSESSLIDTTDGESGDRGSSSTAPSTAPSPSPVSSHGPVTGLPSTPLGGGSLASYTPSKLGDAEGWQPGVTRHTPNAPTAQSPNAKAPSPTEDQASYLKPATPDQTVTWSEGTTADLLF